MKLAYAQHTATAMLLYAYTVSSIVPKYARNLHSRDPSIKTASAQKRWQKNLMHQRNFFRQIDI